MALPSPPPLPLLFIKIHYQSQFFHYISTNKTLFGNYQVNENLLSHCAPNHIVLHCLPAYRGKEISEETLEAHANTIFQQAENRLHAQKAVLATLVE